MLRAAFLGDDEQATGCMPKPNRRTGLVALLSTRSAGTIRVHFALGQELRVCQLGPRRALHKRPACGCQKTDDRLMRETYRSHWESRRAFVHDKIDLNKCFFRRNSSSHSDITSSQTGRLFKNQGVWQPGNARNSSRHNSLQRNDFHRIVPNSQRLATLKSSALLIVALARHEWPHFDDFQIAPFDFFQGMQIVDIPARVRGAADEPIAAVVCHEHAVLL